MEAAILQRHRCDLSGDHSVLGCTLSRRLLPQPPGIDATASHTQLATKTGEGVLLIQLHDQAKPLGGSCSLAK
jgi:hypothetical protein